MSPEKLPPRETNFRPIGLISILAMIVIFLFAYFVLHWDGRQARRARHPVPMESVR